MAVGKLGTIEGVAIACVTSPLLLAILPATLPSGVGVDKTTKLFSQHSLCPSQQTGQFPIVSKTQQETQSSVLNLRCKIFLDHLNDI
jgi:hypothetical protein